MYALSEHAILTEIVCIIKEGIGIYIRSEHVVCKYEKSQTHSVQLMISLSL